MSDLANVASGFTITQIFALVGGLISAILFFFNGYKEKQEGKEQGRDEVLDEWREAERRTSEIIEDNEDETFEMVEAVERNTDDRDPGRMRDEYKLPDWHYKPRSGQSVHGAPGEGSGPADTSE